MTPYTIKYCTTTLIGYQQKKVTLLQLNEYLINERNYSRRGRRLLLVR